MSNFFSKLVEGAKILNTVKEYAENGISKEEIGKVIIDHVPVEESDSDTVVSIMDATVKFKTAKDTVYWNSNNNFGAGEIDTVFIYSETGREPSDFSQMFKPSYQISGITFMTSNLDFKNESRVKSELQSWHQTSDVSVEQKYNSPFLYQAKCESDKVYFEAHYMEYEVDGNIIPYEIRLELHKNKISAIQLQKAIKEYHLMINTLELIK